MASPEQIFIPIAADKLLENVKAYIEGGWRFGQLCATTNADGLEFVYSFVKGADIENLTFSTPNDPTLDSITELVPAAFFFENETSDLYGVTFDGLSLNYNGNFFKLSIPTPMNQHSAQAIEAASKAEGVN